MSCLQDQAGDDLGGFIVEGGGDVAVDAEGDGDGAVAEALLDDPRLIPDSSARVAQVWRGLSTWARHRTSPACCPTGAERGHGSAVQSNGHR